MASRLGWLVPAAALVGLAGCASTASVATDYDRTADFTAPKTYFWREGTKLPNPLMEERIMQAVDANLQEKGLRRVDADGDLTVTYHASAEKSVDIQTFDTGYPYGCWGGCMGTSSTTVRPITTGTLVVDLVDTRTNRLLWRGQGSDTITDDPAETERKIYEIVGRMFAEFPPKP
jgi:hypothetical protein